VWQSDFRLRFWAADDLPALVGCLFRFFGPQPPLASWATGGAIVGLKDGARSFERLEAIIAAGASVSGLWCEDWGRRPADELRPPTVLGLALEP
jgi:alpha-glucosidase